MGLPSPLLLTSITPNPLEALQCSLKKHHELFRTIAEKNLGNHYSEFTPLKKMKKLVDQNSRANQLPYITFLRMEDAAFQKKNSKDIYKIKNSASEKIEAPYSSSTPCLPCHNATLCSPPSRNFQSLACRPHWKTLTMLAVRFVVGVHVWDPS